MLRTRVIPVLLLQGKGLVKTVRFKDPKYIGDPVNAVRIFNEKEVDELVFLDIKSSREGQPPDFDIIRNIASEAFMPLAYGGGVRTVETAKKLFRIGVEKIVLNSIVAERPELISQIADISGNQSVVVSVDVKKNLFGQYEIFSLGGQKKVKEDLLSWVSQMEELGAGEILINSIDRDGTGKGYDHELIKKVTLQVSIPVVACGGAGSLSDLVEVVQKTGVSAVAAGSMFVFYGKHKAVLITYPSYNELVENFSEKSFERNGK